MKKKWMAVLLAAALAVGMFTGCGMDETIVINDKLSGTVSATISVTDAEREELAQSLVEMEYPGYTVEDDPVLVYLDKEKVVWNEEKTTMVNGEKVWVYDMLPQEQSAEELADFFLILTGTQFVATGSSSSGSQDSEGEMELRVTITPPFEVAETSGVKQADGSIVFEGEQSKGRLYAAAAEACDPANPVKLSGAKDGGYYNKPKTVTATSLNCITAFTLDGVEVGDNEVTLITDGNYQIEVDTTGNGHAEMKVCIDRTKPTVNIKAKTYKKSVTIKAKDVTSGVKKITLDGKTVKNGKKVTEKGTHKLVVTDKAGNKKTVKFKIK